MALETAVRNVKHVDTKYKRVLRKKFCNKLNGDVGLHRAVTGVIESVVHRVPRTEHEREANFALVEAIRTHFRYPVSNIDSDRYQIYHRQHGLDAETAERLVGAFLGLEGYF